MKSKRIICILFLILCANVNAHIIIGVEPIVKDALQIDSLYSSYTQIELQKSSAKAVTVWYEQELKNNLVLSNEDLKKLAISYAVLENESKALEYLVKHIKSSHNIDIINDRAFLNFKESAGYQNITKKYRPELNGWILFFLSIGLIGVFIALVLNLRKKSDTRANLLISLFVLFHSFFMIHLGLFLSKYNFSLPHSLYITTSFSFLYGPLLYFYFRRISEKYKFKIIDLLHLAPTIILFLYFLPIYSLSSEDKLQLLYNRDEILHSTLTSVVILKYLSLIVYGYLVYKVYKRNFLKKTKPHIQILSWQKNLMILNIVYVLSYLIYGVALMNIVTSNILIYPQIFAMGIIVLYVGYTAYVQPRVFSKKYLFADELLKYQKSGLTNSFSNDLKEQLLHLLNEEKVYKINNINLDMLSERLGTTRHNISQVINEHFDVNFFNLINKYRIEEAQQIFKKDVHNNLNIIDVAYDVGFNNKVTFNKAFKEETKLTPTQFLQRINGASGLATSL